MLIRIHVQLNVSTVKSTCPHRPKLQAHLQFSVGSWAKLLPIRSHMNSLARNWKQVATIRKFTVENVVTTFHYTFNDKVTCVMTNPVFENLILYTVPVAVVSAGITETDADGVDTMVDVYSVSGVKVRSKVTRADS